MSTGYTPGVTAVKNADILLFGHRLPESLNVVSVLEQGEWVTLVSFGGSCRINGLVTQSMYDGDTLTLGINNRRINAVYQFTEAGEQAINRFSEALTQNCDIGLYICPLKPGRVLLHHKYLNKTLPTVGSAVQTGGSVEIEFAGYCEHTEINCTDKTMQQQTVMSERYKAVIDPINALSTLFKLGHSGNRTLSVTDIGTGMPIYIPREH